VQRYQETLLIVIIAVVLLALAIVKVKPTAAEMYTVMTSLSTKQTESADLERKLETLKAEDAQKDMQLAGQVKKIYKPEAAGMDAESSFTVPFDDIIEMAKYNGVKIYAVEYVYNPTGDEFVTGASDKFNVCQLNMQIIADYSDIESFLKELYKYPYLLNLDKIELSPYEKNKAILLGNLQLKLYASK